MATVTGYRNTANVATVQRYIDIAKPIMKLEPDATPLTAITKSLGTQVAGDVEFSWVESEREVTADSAKAAATKEATEVEVNTESAFAPNQLVSVDATGEILLVKELKGSSKVKVSRGAAGTTAAAIAEKDALTIIAQVAEEGSGSFEARTQNPAKVTNYTQIWKTSIAETGSQGSAQNQTEPHDWVFQHQEKMREHLIGIEKTALYSHKSSTTGAGEKPLRTTGGVLSFYTSNNKDAGGQFTETECEEWVRSLCRYGSSTKTVFCAPLVLSVINAYAVGRLQTIQSDRDSASGVKLTEYFTAHGTLKLVNHNLLEGATFGGYAIAVDFAAAAPKFRPLGGGPMGSRDTKLLTNRQASDTDGQKDEILTEGGFQWPLPKTGGVLTGVTS